MMEVPRITTLQLIRQQEHIPIPNHGKNTKFQGEESDGSVENDIGVEMEKTFENNNGVNSYNSANTSTDYEITDLEETNEKNTDNDTHQTTNSNTNPESFLFAIHQNYNKKFYSARPLSKSVAMTKVGAPPAIKPQTNISN